MALLLCTVEISSRTTPALKENSEFWGIFEFIQKPELFPLRLMLPITAWPLPPFPNPNSPLTAHVN